MRGTLSGGWFSSKVFQTLYIVLPSNAFRRQPEICVGSPRAPGLTRTRHPAAGLLEARHQRSLFYEQKGPPGAPNALTESGAEIFGAFTTATALQRLTGGREWEPKDCLHEPTSHAHRWMTSPGIPRRGGGGPAPIPGRPGWTCPSPLAVTCRPSEPWRTFPA